ncbi:MAG: glycosyltransferase family 4 protein [Planctomycetota bacterium]
MTATDQNRRRRLLVFNCHEAWVHQLSALACDLDIVVDLPGRSVRGWDKRMRPVPPNGRLINLDEALTPGKRYDCIVAHNVTDLLDVRDLSAPRLLVLHSSLEGRACEEGSDVSPADMRRAVSRYLQLTGAHAVAVSPMKARSWGVTDDIVRNGVDIAAYPAHAGDRPEGLRIANGVDKKRRILRWDLHERAFADLPVRLAGHNPQRPGVRAAGSWDELKELLRRARFYVHTADPRYEDGWNMAMLEAMAAGLPVLGNRHPTSVVQHGVSGFLSDSPEALGGFARRLLGDAKLSARMGAAARDAVERHFSSRYFAAGFLRSIARAEHAWRSQRAAATRKPGSARPGVRLGA